MCVAIERKDLVADVVLNEAKGPEKGYSHIIAQCPIYRMHHNFLYQTMTSIQSLTFQMQYSQCTQL